MVWEAPIINDRPIAILGAGVLGRRIACSYVAGGYKVHIRDPSAEAQQAALDYVEANKVEFATHIPGGAPEAFGACATFEHIEDAVRDAWLVVEAVPEVLEIKIDTLGELDRLAPADCIFASNSSSYKSSLMLGKVSADRRPLVCNMHYYMPPAARAVELMTDGETHPEIFTFLTEVLKKSGMQPVTAKKESTGFIFNRFWAAMKREALMIMAEGVSDPKQIDELFTNMFHTSIGPCQMMDGVGLDTVAFIEDNYIKERGLDGSLTVDWLRENYVNKGKLGNKCDKGGFYPPSKQEGF
ncbi:hypothetical protein BX600DRAFT_524063 [Xylariales sp. PMI_506]|nr:hypothetical protein BX600DRAFT_524063 [Xylariales sp. PMI_506]